MRTWKNSRTTNLAGSVGPKTSAGREGRDSARIPEWQMVFSRIMIAARIVSYIVEYTAPVWHRRHVDSRPRRAIHPPISPYHRHPPRTIPLVRPLNGQAKPPPWCSIIDTYPSRRATHFQGCCVHLDASSPLVQQTSALELPRNAAENCGEKNGKYTRK